mmetsp:Transcript_10821/g.33820  ORF Transcript_10821/g.33820 Transcript_10821/m.33820 type:complete len:216 (+) Transcript_10821:1263-1910(+)
MAASASSHMRPMARTASTGNEPLAVSAESITQSVPSRTALATSEASARVGRGAPVMDSNICVAVITGFPAALHLRMISFCAKTTFSIGISMPKSPRPTMIPSLSCRISSMHRRPATFSIFAMMRMALPFCPKTSRTKRTSAALCTKLAATKSTPFGTAKFRRSSRSFSWSTGRSRCTPGRLTFCRSPSVKSFSTLVTTCVNPQERTSSAKRPWAM